MSIFDWLFGDGKREPSNLMESAEQESNEVLSRIALDRERRLEAKEKLIESFKAFPQKVMDAECYRMRDSADLSSEEFFQFAKKWDELKQEEEEIINEYSRQYGVYMSSASSTDLSYQSEIQDAYNEHFQIKDFSESDLLSQYNPYLVRKAISETHIAISDAWPNSSLRAECIQLIDQHFLSLKKAFREAIENDKYGRVVDNRSFELREFLTSFKYDKYGRIIDAQTGSFSILGELEKFCTDRFSSKEFKQILSIKFCLTEYLLSDWLSDKFCLKDDFIPFWDLFSYLEQKIMSENSINAAKGFEASNYPKDGIEFERWVEQQLLNFEWKAQITKASSDQGVDIIAEKNDLTVAIQCKRYSHPVGNKAVQEIAAGLQHYMTDFGVVISTFSYTKSAEKLALSNDIKLLRVDDIPNLYSILVG